jgi:3-dehydroquinate synthase
MKAPSAPTPSKCLRSNSEASDFWGPQTHHVPHLCVCFSGLVLYGEAVATGVLLDSIYAQGQGWITQDELARIDAGLRQSQFALWFDTLNLRDESGQR